LIRLNRARQRSAPILDIELRLVARIDPFETDVPRARAARLPRNRPGIFHTQIDGHGLPDHHTYRCIVREKFG
jgi:hypothetical protein